MTARDFCYWLQGCLEMRAAHGTPTEGMSASEVECIQRHLAMVFIHEIDPSMGGKAHQEKLDEAHTPMPKVPKPSGGGGGGGWPGGPVMRC